MALVVIAIVEADSIVGSVRECGRWPLKLDSQSASDFISSLYCWTGGQAVQHSQAQHSGQQQEGEQ